MPDKLNNQLFESYADEAQQRDFFAALGRALSGWQFVESALYLVHEAAILPAIPSAFAASFHQVQTFRLKLQITDMALRACLIERVNDAVLVSQNPSSMIG